jgi:glycogen synthase kinase 3 beta
MTTITNLLSVNFTLNKKEKFDQCIPVTLGEEFGSGAFGKVYVVDTPTGRIAVKRVPELADHVNRELETCTLLAEENHPNIVKFLGYWIENKILFLVMEFMPETLNRLLERLLISKMRMKMCLMNELMMQLALALEHLDKLQLMHRDIKPDNILVNVYANRLVLADFGSAKFLKKGQSHTTYMCTRFYRAPCLIMGRDMYSTSVDIWSFGCVLAEFAYGGPLFTGNTQIDVMAKIIKIRGMVTINDIAHMPTSLPENIKMADIGLVSAIKPWYKVFTRRINDKRVNTSYGNKYEQILDDCLQWNPSNRISACDLVYKFKNDTLNEPPSV